MELNLPYIDDKFERVYDKLDEISKKQTDFELQMSRKVDRNTLILNGIVWFVGLVVTANVVCLVRYLW